MSDEIPHGTVIYPKMYLKIVTDKHYFKKYQGFGISNYVLEKLIKDDVKYIRIIYDGIGVRKDFLCTTSQYMDSPHTHEFEEGDTQKILPEKQMLLTKVTKK